MNNFREMSKVFAWWFAKTLREIRKYRNYYMNPKDKDNKGSTLTISLCKINIHHPLSLAQGIMPK
jgi:hypothetical protein